MGSVSLCQLPWESKTSKRKFSLFCHSLPMILGFETFATDRAGRTDILDAWFDEVFLPLENVQSVGSFPDGLEENQLPQDEIQDLNRLVLDEGINAADLDHEVAKLTQTLTECRNHSAFDWCRRGAISSNLVVLTRPLKISMLPSPWSLIYWMPTGTDTASTC